MTPIVRAGGSFCDVVPRAAGGYAFVYLAAGRLVCERVDGAGVPVLSWSVLAPSMPGLYLRAASGPDGQVACAYQGQNGSLYVSVDGSAPVACGGTFGGHVVGLHWQDGFRALVQRTRTNLQRIALPALTVLENIAIPGTSQGIRDVRPDGSFILSDVGRVQTVAGWTLHDPITRGDVTVGQCATGIAVVRPVGGFTAIRGDAFEPHLALDGDVVLVSARTPHGATLARFVPPYPNIEAVPVAVPPPAPLPPPEVFMGPWKVTFDESYTKTIARGVGAVARCAIGNGIEIEWQKGADDTIHFAVYKDEVLQNRSRLPRHVDVVG